MYKTREARAEEVRVSDIGSQGLERREKTTGGRYGDGQQKQEHNKDMEKQMIKIIIENSNLVKHWAKKMYVVAFGVKKN